MSKKIMDHIMKSSSDGDLSDSESNGVTISSLRVRNDFNNYSSETKAKLERTFTLSQNPFPKGTGKKTKAKLSSKENFPGPKITSSNQTLINQAVTNSQEITGLSEDSESDKSELMRTPSTKKVSTIVENKAACADFDNKRSPHLFMSVNHLQVPPGKLTFPADKVPGVVGLRNHGNTCFINAVLQCLTHTDCLAEYFVTNLYKADLISNKMTSKKYGTKGEVTEQLALLLKSVWHCQYDPDISNQFNLVVYKYGTQYSDENQHDAQEFLIWLLDKVHEDLNRAAKRNYKVNKSSFNRPDEEVAKETLANHVRCNNSFIHAVFQAQFRSSLTCIICQRQSNTFDPFLCVSLPIPPHKQKRSVYVTVLYISQRPRQVTLGLSLNENSTVSELREQLSSDTSIPESCIVLTQIDDFGFQRTFSGQLPISEIKEADPFYCIEMPLQRRGATEELEKYILLSWVNVLTTDNHCSRFGSPYIMQICRLACYRDIQKLMLKEMSTILHGEILTKEQYIPLFRIKIAFGVNLESSYLDPTVDHPLYMEEIDQALALLDEDSGPRHLKLVLEWDLPAKESTIAYDSDIITVHSSVKQLLSQSDRGDSVTLKECFEFYTRAEVLSGEDKWHCPFCNRKQEVIKKLGLWSLPDILVIHLKRFSQRSCKNRSATKLMMLVDFPIHGFDMNSHLVGPNRDSTTSLSLWCPWRKSRRTISYDDNVYDLYAICNHHGKDLQEGHYTAHCLNPYDDQWYFFDDDKVERVSETSLVTNSAYILFYQRRGLGGSNHSARTRSSMSSEAEHWVSRMPAFNYPGKKVKK